MRAFTPRAASLRTSVSASGRVLYAASWMVQMPRGAEALVAGSLAGASPVGAFRPAAVGGVRVVVVSARRGGGVLGAAFTEAGAVAGTLLLTDVGGGDDETVGAPDDRTLAATGAGVAAAEAEGVDGHRAPW